MLKRILAASLVATLMALPACAAEPSPGTITDPAVAAKDAEYQVQGEYEGAIGDKKVGLQVVALGENKFDGYLLDGGLPGAGYTRENNRVRSTGSLANGVTTLSTSDWTATIKDGKVSVQNADGKQIGSLARVDRKSPTLGKKAPQGAVILFGGEDANDFPGTKVTADGYLMVPGESKTKFEDHTLHVEFRTPFKPAARGQARGNSGVYVQSRYEIQVLDSFGLDGKNNECGGIYSISEPIVNMCLPPLTWQTYDIDFTAAKYDGDQKVSNARVTVKQNGVVIHDNLELPHGTPGKAQEGPAPLGVYLQGHGNPVVFKNVWAVTK